MSQYYFSASTHGFYTQTVHSGAMPSDVVEISEQEWLALLDAQSRGMVIRADENGRPIPVRPEAT